MRLNAQLQEVRGEMKMSRVGEVIEVEILPGEFGDRSHVGECVAPAIVLKIDGKAGSCGTGNGADARGIHGTLLKTLQGELAEWVIAHARLKTDAASERSQVVGHDRGGAADGQHHAIGEKLALGNKLLGKAVEDEIEVEFTGNRDIETGHGSGQIPSGGLVRLM